MTDPFHPEELALLAAIHAEPLDLDPRLDYADWLQKHGEGSHAEFIRIQCGDPPVIIAPQNTYPQRSEILIDYRPSLRAEAEFQRLSELLPGVLASPRYRHHQALEMYEEQVCGLPLLQMQLRAAPSFGDEVLSKLGPLPRLDLWLYTNQLAGWLAHPLMDRVDVLRVWPEFPPDFEPDDDGTHNHFTDPWWARNMPVLAASPLLDRLIRLEPCCCMSTNGITPQSARNIALCKELIEPRVPVHYWG